MARGYVSFHDDDDVEVSEPVDTFTAVFTSRLSGIYHLDVVCAGRECPKVVDPRLSAVGAVEAILAVHYGRRACPDCAAEFGEALSALLPRTRSCEKPNSASVPLRAVDWDDGSFDVDGDTAPYGAPTDPDDIRFGFRSMAGWGTHAFGIDPTEFLSEPTDDDHDWIRGPSRFLD